MEASEGSGVRAQFPPRHLSFLQGPGPGSFPDTWQDTPHGRDLWQGTDRTCSWRPCLPASAVN